MSVRTRRGRMENKTGDGRQEKMGKKAIRTKKEEGGRNSNIKTRSNIFMQERKQERKQQFNVSV